MIYNKDLVHHYHNFKEPVIELLLNNGYRKVKEDTETDDYGSVHSIYFNDSHHFMLFWDGEEAFGGVEKYEGNNQWKMLRPIVPESENKISQLSKTI